MKFVFLILTLMLASMEASPASVEQIHKLDTHEVTARRITIAAQTIPAYGMVKAVISRREGRPDAIGAIQAIYLGNTVTIPDKALASMERVFMDTWQIRTEPGYDAFPWLYLVVKAPHKTAAGEAIPKTIHFAFYRGKFKRVSISTPLSKDSSQWQSMEY